MKEPVYRCILDFITIGSWWWTFFNLMPTCDPSRHQFLLFSWYGRVMSSCQIVRWNQRNVWHSHPKTCLINHSSNDLTSWLNNNSLTSQLNCNNIGGGSHPCLPTIGRLLPKQWKVWQTVLGSLLTSFPQIGIVLVVQGVGIIDELLETTVDRKGVTGNLLNCMKIEEGPHRSRNENETTFCFSKLPD